MGKTSSKQKEKRLERILENKEGKGFSLTSKYKAHLKMFNLGKTET